MPRRLDFYPDILGKDWWHATNYPRQLLNQKFAIVLGDEDLSNCDVHEFKGFKCRPRMPASVKASGKSVVKIDETGFKVTLDLEDFELGELSVETDADGCIEVRGTQQEKKDQYGLVSREFTRRYMIPYNCNSKAVTSSFSADGKLTIFAPNEIKEQMESDKVVSLKDTLSQAEYACQVLSAGEWEESLKKEVKQTKPMSVGELKRCVMNVAYKAEISNQEKNYEDQLKMILGKGELFPSYLV